MKHCLILLITLLTFAACRPAITSTNLTIEPPQENLELSLLSLIRNLDDPSFISTKYKDSIYIRQNGDTLTFFYYGDLESENEIVGLAGELLFFGAWTFATEESIRRIELINPSPENRTVTFYVSGTDTIQGIKTGTVNVWDVMIKAEIDWRTATPTDTPVPPSVTATAVPLTKTSMPITPAKTATKIPTTVPSRTPPPLPPPSTEPLPICDPAYPDPGVCIPPFPPDLDCPEIPFTDFTALPSDPHRLDRDKDGIACES